MRIPNEFYSERFSDILTNSYNFIQVLHQISFQHVFDLKKMKMKQAQHTINWVHQRITQINLSIFNDGRFQNNKPEALITWCCSQICTHNWRDLNTWTNAILFFIFFEAQSCFQQGAETEYWRTWSKKDWSDNHAAKKRCLREAHNLSHAGSNSGLSG